MENTIREQLKSSFRDYFNNYLSVEAWATDNDLSAIEARTIIDIGRDLHDEDAEALQKLISAKIAG